MVSGANIAARISDVSIDPTHRWSAGHARRSTIQRDKTIIVLSSSADFDFAEKHHNDQSCDVYDMNYDYIHLKVPHICFMDYYFTRRARARNINVLGTWLKD